MNPPFGTPWGGKDAPEGQDEKGYTEYQLPTCFKYRNSNRCGHHVSFYIFEYEFWVQDYVDISHNVLYTICYNVCPT